MIIKVLPNKIPKIWDTIKFAVHQTTGPSNLESYLNNLLHSLLSSKAQCFIRPDATNRKIDAIGITKILINDMTGERYLLICYYYGFKAGSNKDWNEAMNMGLEFAKKEGCSYVTSVAYNPKVIDLMKRYGFKETHKVLEYRIGG